MPKSGRRPPRSRSLAPRSVWEDFKSGWSTTFVSGLSMKEGWGSPSSCWRGFWPCLHLVRLSLCFFHLSLFLYSLFSFLHSGTEVWSPGEAEEEADGGPSRNDAVPSPQLHSETQTILSIRPIEWIPSPPSFLLHPSPLLQASPPPVVTWFKDGVITAGREVITTSKNHSQLLISTSQRSDSGVYRVHLKNDYGEAHCDVRVRVTGNGRRLDRIWNILLLIILPLYSPLSFFRLPSTSEEPPAWRGGSGHGDPAVGSHLRLGWRRWGSTLRHPQAWHQHRLLVHRGRARLQPQVHRHRTASREEVLLPGDRAELHRRQRSLGLEGTCHHRQGERWEGRRLTAERWSWSVCWINTSFLCLYVRVRQQPSAEGVRCTITSGETDVPAAPEGPRCTQRPRLQHELCLSGHANTAGMIWRTLLLMHPPETRHLR